MTMIVKKANLFSMPNEYYLAHCISADYEMGAGIAVDFQKRFHLRTQLQLAGKGKYPDCLLVGRVFNLVTKKYYYNKPTYANFIESVTLMKHMCQDRQIKKLATYKLGCTRDRLSWPRVREILEEAFSQMDTEIVICHN